MLGDFTALQELITGTAIEQALIDHPCERLDARTAQIFLQRGGFMHRRGLWQSHQQDARELGIAQAFEEFENFLRLGAAGLALQLALISLAGIKQQQRVAGGRSVEHDEAICTLSNFTGKSTENGDLLGAG